MFNDSRGLISLDLSSFDTSQVTNMSYLFGNCKSLTTLNLSSFNTNKVTNMGGMFSACFALTTLTTGVTFQFVDADYSIPGTWQNTAGETFTSGNFPSNVADTYTKVA